MTEAECREIVLARSGAACERCGTAWPLSLHHRKKRSQGGGWCPSNCVMVCGIGTTLCHGWIESHPVSAEEHGWHIRPWDDPSHAPIFSLLDREWYFINPDGTKEMVIP